MSLEHPPIHGEFLNAAEHNPAHARRIGSVAPFSLRLTPDEKATLLQRKYSTTNMQPLTNGVFMAVMTIRNIDDEIKRRLRVRAAMHGKSMEDEARDILRSALSTEVPRPRNLGQAIHARFAALGGVDLPELPREVVRRPVDFGA